ncbi:MAG: PQQ-binding-like beta-propeller repeat protein, partial [Planctomycetaceae bacterium]
MWRGPRVDGIAQGPAVPSTWSETDNVVWRAEIPGRGHSSPIVLGDRVFLETANEQTRTQSVLAYDLRTGNALWETELFRDGFE